jgi:hypothetical protein
MKLFAERGRHMYLGFKHISFVVMFSRLANLNYDDWFSCGKLRKPSETLLCILSECWGQVHVLCGD